MLCAHEPLQVTLRSREETSPGSGRHHAILRKEGWETERTAIIVCDVWDLHHCRNAVRRVEEFAPRLNKVLIQGRGQGMTIIHAPSDCMDAYADHPARKRAIAAPTAADTPPDIQSWCSRIPTEEAAEYPLDQSDGGEDDDPDEHAAWAQKLADMGRNPKAPWKRQSDLIEIDADRDYVSDRGHEVWNILSSRGIEHVILTGVHTNMCVLGRPFGLRQLAKNGKHVVLMRDMTDTMYNPQRWPHVSHFTGNDLIVEHIEKYVCPTITSDQFLGGQTFRFRDDHRRHIAIVMAEDEYETERTLPRFARTYLGLDFRVSLVFGSDSNKNDIPGLDIVDEADVLLVSVRRRPLPSEQLDAIRSHVKAGKPVVGIRTASHAFSLRDSTPLEGLEAWPTFDQEVLGGNYHGHLGNELVNHVRILPAQSGNLILSGIRGDEFEVGGSLYQVSPLQPGANVLMTGRVEGAPEEPVAWTFFRADGGATFYTSLGFKTDFAGNKEFLRLLRNGIYWAAGLNQPADLPVEGTLSDFQRQWMPLAVPATWAEASRGVLADHRGLGWYRCVVRIPSQWVDARLLLELPARKGRLAAYWNGQEIELERTDNSPESLAGTLPTDNTQWGDANLLVVRIDPTSAGDDAAGLTDAPVLTASRIRATGDVEGSNRGREDIVGKLTLAGTWQFRIGDDPEFSRIPLPAKFAAGTDVIFEPEAARGR